MVNTWRRVKIALVVECLCMCFAVDELESRWGHGEFLADVHADADSYHSDDSG